LKELKGLKELKELKISIFNFFNFFNLINYSRSEPLGKYMAIWCLAIMQIIILVVILSCVKL